MRLPTFIIVLCSSITLSACALGPRPTLVEDLPVGDANIISLLDTFALVDSAEFTATYRINVNYGNTTATAIVTQGEQERSITIGDTRYLVETGRTRTCDLASSSCSQGLDDTKVSDLHPNPTTWGQQKGTMQGALFYTSKLFGEWPYDGLHPTPVDDVPLSYQAMLEAAAERNSLTAAAASAAPSPPTAATGRDLSGGKKRKPDEPTPRSSFFSSSSSDTDSSDYSDSKSDPSDSSGSSRRRRRRKKRRHGKKGPGEKSKPKKVSNTSAKQSSYVSEHRMYVVVTYAVLLLTGL